MGFQVGPSCYGNAVAAVQAAASSQVGAIVVHGGAAYVVDAGTATESSITYSLQPVGGGATIAVTAQVTPQPCGLLDWQDGLVLGWGIAAVWIAAAVVMVARRGAQE